MQAKPHFIPKPPLKARKENKPMTKIFIASFEYSQPRLAKADFIKQTERQIHITNYEDIFNSYYLPNRLDKSLYHTFFDLLDALSFLQDKSNAHIEKLQNEIASVENWKIKLSNLSEKIKDNKI